MESKNNEIIRQVVLAKKGEKDAFCYLIRYFENDLYKVANGILNDYDSILDVISETTLKAFENIKKLKEPEFFKTWLIRILINECNLILRKQKKIVYLNEYQEMESKKENIESNIDIKNCISQLDEKTREVVILYYINDIEVKEIATILNIPEGTVKTRLLSARNKMKSILGYEEAKENV